MKFEKREDSFSSDHLGGNLFVFLKNYKIFLSKEVAKHDLSLMQGFALLLIHDCEEINQNDLAKGLYLTKGAVTKGIKKLLDDDLILREKHPKDKRNFLLKLSPKGEEFIPILQEMNEKWESKMGLDSLSPEFMETLNELTLKSIELNMENEL